MPPKKRPSRIELSRLKVLAAGDEAAFLAHALELLASGDRLAREAALAALLERPLPAARDALRDLYFALDADGLKLDQGASMRELIVRSLGAIGDSRDRDIAARASETVEIILGQDVAWQLRVHGLHMLARIALDVFPYYAIEHLDDYAGIDGEPANTAFQLLAATGHHLPIYQWLISADREPTLVAGAFELLAAGPRNVAGRFAVNAIDVAIRRANDALSTVLAEAIVSLELAPAYPALGRLMSSKLSDELYNYLAVLLAGTNRLPLLALLEDQLHRGRHPRVVAAALRIRTTPEQAAILKRWEDGDA